MKPTACSASKRPRQPAPSITPHTTTKRRASCPNVVWHTFTPIYQETPGAMAGSIHYGNHFKKEKIDFASQKRRFSETAATVVNPTRPLVPPPESAKIGYCGSGFEIADWTDMPLDKVFPVCKQQQDTSGVCTRCRSQSSSLIECSVSKKHVWCAACVLRTVDSNLSEGKPCFPIFCIGDVNYKMDYGCSVSRGDCESNIDVDTQAETPGNHAKHGFHVVKSRCPCTIPLDRITQAFVTMRFKDIRECMPGIALKYSSYLDDTTATADFSMRDAFVALVRRLLTNDECTFNLRLDKYVDSPGRLVVSRCRAQVANDFECGWTCVVDMDGGGAALESVPCPACHSSVTLTPGFMNEEDRKVAMAVRDSFYVRCTTCNRRECTAEELAVKTNQEGLYMDKVSTESMMMMAQTDRRLGSGFSRLYYVPYDCHTEKGGSTVTVASMCHKVHPIAFGCQCRIPFCTACGQRFPASKNLTAGVQKHKIDSPACFASVEACNSFAFNQVKRRNALFAVKQTADADRFFKVAPIVLGQATCNEYLPQC